MLSAVEPGLPDFHFLCHPHAALRAASHYKLSRSFLSLWTLPADPCSATSSLPFPLCRAPVCPCFPSVLHASSHLLQSMGKLPAAEVLSKGYFGNDMAVPPKTCDVTGFALQESNTTSIHDNFLTHGDQAQLVKSLALLSEDCVTVSRVAVAGKDSEGGAFPSKHTIGHISLQYEACAHLHSYISP